MGSVDLVERKRQIKDLERRMQYLEHKVDTKYAPSLSKLLNKLTRPDLVGFQAEIKDEKLTVLYNPLGDKLIVVVADKLKLFFITGTRFDMKHDVERFEPIEDHNGYEELGTHDFESAFKVLYRRILAYNNNPLEHKWGTNKFNTEQRRKRNETKKFRRGSYKR